MDIDLAVLDAFVQRLDAELLELQTCSALLRADLSAYRSGDAALAEAFR